MNLTRRSLENPVAVLVGVLLVLLLGAISLFRLPIQLTPEVEEPEITIETGWRASAPKEVEAEIVEPQEKALRGLPGLVQMLSNSRRGRGKITLRFSVGTDMGRSLLEVMNRLNRVPSYPEDADEPVISTVGGDSRPIAWFIFKTLPGNSRAIASYQNFMEEVVQARFERIPGIARSEVRGGRTEELRITFDPYKAASLGIQLPATARLAGSGKNISGGFARVGKRRYTIRFAGQYGLHEAKQMILEWRDGRPIRLGDVAEVQLALADRDSFVITKGEHAMAVNAHRETGVNVLTVMDGLYQAVQELREGPLAQAGLSIEQVYDETLYIHRSLRMLGNNLGLGMLLAVVVLWWFLRRFRATLLVAVAIPLALFMAFLVLDASGRTLNVISLAGLALSAGMVLDAAIVVLENIVRLREQGLSSHRASIRGTHQVWGALLASTATTVAIFVPVIFLRDEAGQLFSELALTIAIAVSASLLVAITVIPTAARQWLRRQSLQDPHQHWWQSLTRRIMFLTDTPLRRGFWIIGLVATSVGLTLSLIPKADYLPQGNRNLSFAFILPAPGVNIDFLEQRMGKVIAKRMEPYLTGKQQPQVKHYFFVAFPGGAFMGARATDPTQAKALVGLINQLIQGFPDTLAFAKQASLFGRLGAGGSIDINLQGGDIEALLAAAKIGYDLLKQILPDARIRARPGLSLAEPELRLQPNERRIAEAGWQRGDLSGIIRALGDGLFVGDYFDGNQRLNIILRAQPWNTPEALATLPLATPNAGIQPLGELVQIERTAGPNQIRRIDRRRTITLQVTPPKGLSLEETLQILKEKVEPTIQDLLPEEGEIRYSGVADQLETALQNMGGSFVLAIIILYLLMSALFRSFKDSLLVLLVIPLATVGGVVALYLLNLVSFQTMDLLTMIGFVILLGLVVNNAILLVHQTRFRERSGEARRDAVENAVHSRLRPILMSTLTSLFGMLPLVLIPGAGTELYRGLATVIVGGMSVSTVFTLLLLPSLLRLGEK